MSRFLFSQKFETKKKNSQYFTKLKINSTVADEPIYDPKHCFFIWKVERQCTIISSSKNVVSRNTDRWRHPRETSDLCIECREAG